MIFAKLPAPNIVNSDSLRTFSNTILRFYNIWNPIQRSPKSLWSNSVGIDWRYRHNDHISLRCQPSYECLFAFSIILHLSRHITQWNWRIFLNSSSFSNSSSTNYTVVYKICIILRSKLIRRRQREVRYYTAPRIKCPVSHKISPQHVCLFYITLI